MKKFNILKGIPANLPIMNVDTDMIIPKQFLKTIKRTGLGKNIFYNNCFKNGMLPIILDVDKIEELVQYSKRKESIEINLENEKITFGNKIINFKIDAFKKKCLLNGLDDIALSLNKEKNITSFENEMKKNKPWIN